MAWLANTTARATLTINAVDYSAEFVRFEATDSSLVASGIMTTQGRITLRELPGQNRLVDYEKKKFGRGIVCRISLTQAGTTRQHPRGYLVVIDSTYNTDDRSLTLEVGCPLLLFSLTDNITSLRSYTAFALPAEAGFTDLSNALQTERSFVWANSAGVIEKRSFFGTDRLGSDKEAPAWLSVRDHTSLAATPLGAGLTVPDRILVSYVWTIDAGTDNPETEDGTPFDEDITESSYYLEHPANVPYTSQVCETRTGGVVVCTDVTLQDGKRTFAVTKTESSRRNYGGPGGSVVNEVSVTYGPAMELNGSYYAERFSWERARNGGSIDGVPFRGLENILQQRSEKTYTYGSGGEVTKTVQRDYRSLLSAMTQTDWRSGGKAVLGPATPGVVEDPGVRGFLTEPPVNETFLSSMITTEYEYFDDKTIERTQTLTSSATCNDVGIYPKIGPRILQDIDATTNGVLETVKRTSRSGLRNPAQTDRVTNAADTITKADIITEESSKYTPTSAGSITYETSVPFTVPADTKAQAQERADQYAKHLRKLLEGDSAGIRIAEAMRPELFGYYPGMPFGFWDRQADKVVRLRMNATAWGVTAEDAVVSTDGLFIGISDATMTLGSNTGAYVAPTFTGETTVDDGRPYAVQELIEIAIGVGVVSLTGNADDGIGIVTPWVEPIETEVSPNVGIVVFGEKVGRGARLLELDLTGSLPVNANGSLLQDTALVLNPDLFDPDAINQPDQTFAVRTGAPAANRIFDVKAFAEPANQIFAVKRGPNIPNQTFDVVSIKRWQVSAAELPFIVTSGPTPPNQIIAVRRGPTPPTRTYVVQRGANIPNRTIAVRKIEDVIVVRTGAAAPNQRFVVTTGPRSAPNPSRTIDVSVGGPGAPPLVDPDVTLAVRVFANPPNAIRNVLVIDRIGISVAEPPFVVTTGAEAADQTIQVRVDAPPPDGTFVVTRGPDPVQGTFVALVVQDPIVVEAFNAPKAYSVQASSGSGYVFTGSGLFLDEDPALTLTVGQAMGLSINTPDDPLWIKTSAGTGAGQTSPSWARVTNNGIASGILTIQFLVTGTYYFASEFDAAMGGTITVT